MEILTEITKAVFEEYVPAAKMPANNTSVFDRITDQLERSYDVLVAQVIGDDLVSTVESVADAKDLIKRVVCNHAFLQVMRSLDVVLTATGFGVVNTNSTAPASKMRVDALEESIRQLFMSQKEELVAYLATVDGWGSTSPAKMYIDVLFWRPSYVKQFTVKEFTSQNWRQARGLAVTADSFLRKVISDEYMDELLVKTRTSALTNEDMIVVEKCNRATGYFISCYEKGEKSPSKHMLDAIMDHLETYITTYTTYAESSVYAARHADRYTNQKEDPSFFFM